MANQVNYQKQLEQILTQQPEKRRSLLLHSCCAPCSSYVLEYLRPFFDITVFYYNPNITEQEEYRKRVAEQIRLIERMNLAATGQNDCQEMRTITVIEGPYEPDLFLQMAQGMEACPEGGGRCLGCYELRLRKTAELAKQQGFDYMTTTLSISPLKNAQKLNEIGQRLAEEYGIAHLPADFKKKNGYKRSVELSVEYGLYRQDYCGCIYSKRKPEEAAIIRQ